MKISIPLLILFLSFGSSAQSISEAVCYQHNTILRDIIFEYRRNEVPIKISEDMFNFEEDLHTRIYVKKMVRMIYKDPENSIKIINGGTFSRECIKIHRGF